MPDPISGELPVRRYHSTLTLPAPAAGAEWSTTVPAGVSWELLSVYASLTTSAVVATRRPRLVIGDGTATALSIPGATNIAAGSTNRYAWLQDGSSVSVGSDSQTGIGHLYLDAGFTVGSDTVNLDVGDAWSAVKLLLLITLERAGPLDLAELGASVLEVVAERIS